MPRLPAKYGGYAQHAAGAAGHETLRRLGRFTLRIPRHHAKPPHLPRFLTQVALGLSVRGRV